MEGNVNMNYFYLDKIEDNLFMIRINTEKVPIGKCSSSLNILGARLLGLEYADYLRYCRDCYGAQLIRKNSYYVVPVYNNVNSPAPLINKLNLIVKEIMQKRDTKI